MAFTCSKSTIETPEHCVKSVHCCGVSIANFEQVNTGWETKQGSI